jgi:hypothetical protein
MLIIFDKHRRAASHNSRINFKIIRILSASLELHSRLGG